MRRFIVYSILSAIFFYSGSCQKPTDPNDDVYMSSIDVHSFAKPDQVQMQHLSLDLKVNFDKKILEGTAEIHLENKEKASSVFLDVSGLVIEKIILDDGQPAIFKLGKAVKYLGQPLEITIKPETKKLKIYYQTSPQAAALQWLSAEQTAGKKYPFLFSQSQCILARTWIPCQDSPGIRFTYEARIQVAEDSLMAVMSADNPTKRNENGIYEFSMKQKIPAYLVALAVGNIEFKEIDNRTGIYAEPSMMEASVKEFEDLGRMLTAAEKLYGKYEWDRYDILVLPPSFPFGGMENPRLTFATPTILAGDKSLVSLIAHELAHSWSGNLVTNATWNDFWLNEGFTVYFERRIMEELQGRDYAEMLALLGYQDLQVEIEHLGENNKDTRLLLDLRQRDPDQAVTEIAYEKGYFFLRTIEQAIGREKFDQFIRKYFQTFAFKAMDTQKFIEYFQKEILDNYEDIDEKIQYKDWIFGTGIPENCPKVNSLRFAAVDKQLQRWKKERLTDSLDTAGWSSHEWLHFIRHLPVKMDREDMKSLDKQFKFTDSGNSEIQAAWYLHAIHNNYEPANQAMVEFLEKVGRRKFLTPLYTEFLKSSQKEKALKIYTKARPGYHYVVQNSLDELLAYEQGSKDSVSKKP